jgi:hypothetical protein
MVMKTIRMVLMCMGLAFVFQSAHAGNWVDAEGKTVVDAEGQPIKDGSE